MAKNIAKKSTGQASIAQILDLLWLQNQGPEVITWLAPTFAKSSANLSMISTGRSVMVVMLKGSRIKVVLTSLQPHCGIVDQKVNGDTLTPTTRGMTRHSHC